MKIDHCCYAKMLHVSYELIAIDEIEADVFENFAYSLRIKCVRLLEKAPQLKNVSVILAKRLISFLDHH